ncbi:prepilin-type N-terminal cleavage/methylation domain-containing protein [Geomonas sp. RF6]|uniref:prepilin-type N-terminal cleavage/methylation domain-containing protein n=1 Tax=Geomonas sp. RF6 TaxID=2897342 RepID=UPI001E3F22A2|nr:prepilin-type N-terminal cleavage/methylation domain-containing protein [Geomonas sp. RF6]UFS71599.1 prepilin-type N-terminal cleavage/methylation domain-containing protein [Geomonas sp. RF6]
MKGFTLLEVMIALAIAAGVLLTVISSVNYHLSIVGDDREETVAALVGRAKLEDPDFVKISEKKGTFAPEHPELSWERETTPTELPTVSRTVLTVSWQDGKKRLSLVQFTSK